MVHFGLLQLKFGDFIVIGPGHSSLHLLIIIYIGRIWAVVVIVSEIIMIMYTDYKKNKEYMIWNDMICYYLLISAFLSASVCKFASCSIAFCSASSSSSSCFCFSISFNLLFSSTWASSNLRYSSVLLFYSDIKDNDSIIVKDGGGKL